MPKLFGSFCINDFLNHTEALKLPPITETSRLASLKDFDKFCNEVSKRYDILKIFVSMTDDPKIQKQALRKLTSLQTESLIEHTHQTVSYLNKMAKTNNDIPEKDFHSQMLFNRIQTRNKSHIQRSEWKLKVIDLRLQRQEMSLLKSAKRCASHSLKFRNHELNDSGISFINRFTEYLDKWAQSLPIKLFESIVSLRNQKASLFGHASFADMVCSESVLKSKHKIHHFLHKILADSEKNDKKSSAINGRKESYYTTDQTFSNLKSFLSAIFHLSLQAVPFARGEETFTSKKVFKFKITSQKFSPLHSKPASGEIYFDLSNELGQKDQSSHFIIQNGILGPSKSELFAQIPKVYVRVNVEDESKISQQEFENIFHEAGHAVHTILGTNQYQQLSGSSITPELAEIPAHFFEFAAKNNLTGEDVPETIHKIKNSLQNFDEFTADPINAANGLIDMHIHSNSSIKVANLLDYICIELSKTYPSMNRLSPNDYVRDHSRHFIDYPSGYYSYSFAEKIAMVMWRDIASKIAKESDNENVALPIGLIQAMSEGRAVDKGSFIKGIAIS